LLVFKCSGAWIKLDAIEAGPTSVKVKDKMNLCVCAFSQITQGLRPGVC